MVLSVSLGFLTLLRLMTAMSPHNNPKSFQRRTLHLLIISSVIAFYIVFLGTARYLASIVPLTSTPLLIGITTAFVTAAILFHATVTRDVGVYFAARVDAFQADAADDFVGNFLAGTLEEAWHVLLDYMPEDLPPDEEADSTSLPVGGLVLLTVCLGVLYGVGHYLLGRWSAIMFPVFVVEIIQFWFVQYGSGTPTEVTEGNLASHNWVIAGILLVFLPL